MANINNSSAVAFCGHDVLPAGSKRGTRCSEETQAKVPKIQKRSSNVYTKIKNQQVGVRQA